MIYDIQRVEKSHPDAIQQQWDDIARTRDEQLRSGRDVSFDSILKPTVFSLIEDIDKTSVLDIGCGSGVLTEALAQTSRFVTGVDFSAKNIAIAREKSTNTNVKYIHSSIEQYPTRTTEQYSLIVANMVLQDVSELEACLSSIAIVSAARARLVATITHPWFWPTYWGYDREAWFNYAQEHAIEAPFRISSEPTSIGVTTHFHRPLSTYINSLKMAGFELETLLEPMPTGSSIERDIKNAYLPRFLALRCKYRQAE